MDKASTLTPPERSPKAAPRPAARRAPLALAWALLLGLWAVTLAGRWNLSPPAPLLALVILLPWLYGLSALVLAFLALFARRGRRRWLPLLLLLCSALLLWGPHWLPRFGSREADERLRMMSWNLGRFGKWSLPQERRCQGDAAFAAVRAALEAERPDVVAIQEVSHNKLQRLAAELGYDCRQTDYYGKGYQNAGGLAACVRRGSPWTMNLSRTLPLPPSWHYVYIELCNGGRCFNFLALHVKPYGAAFDQLWEVSREAAHGHFAPMRQLSAQVEANVSTQAKQIRKVLQVLSTLKDPTVIAGDFNSTRDTAIHAALRGPLQDAWEQGGTGLGITRWVGGWLPLRIDYLYLTHHWWVLNTRVLTCACEHELACSDHRAVLAEVALVPPQ